MNTYLVSLWAQEMGREHRRLSVLEKRREGLYGRKRRSLERRIKATQIAIGLWQGRIAEARQAAT